MTSTLSQDAHIKCNLKAPFPLQCAIQKLPTTSALLITENANLAILWDPRNNSSSRSWNFPSINPLTCPIMYEPNTDRLVAVRRHQTLTVLKMNEDVSDADEIALLPHMRVKCLVSDRHRLYVWLESGEVFSLNQLLRLCGHTLSEDASLQDLMPVKPLFRFSSGEQIERILDVPSFNRQSSLGFLINSNGERFVQIYTFNSKQVMKTKILLNSDEQDIVCSYDHLIVIDPDYRVYAVKPENRTFLFDLSSLVEQNQIVRFKYLMTGKNLSTVIVIAKGENGKQIMFGYDPTYRTETQKIQIDPLLDSHSDNLFYFNSKLFTISKLGVQAFHLSIKRITLVEAINQQVEHRKASLLVNGDLKEQKMTAKQISATLARQLKPKELEQTLVQSIELIIDGSLSVKDMTELKRLTFSFRFAHQFLVHELKAIQFDREQLAKLVQLLNEQMHLASNQKIDIVFNWTGALFDAYFIAFNSLTNRTLLDLLKQIQRTLQDKIDLFQTQKQLQQSIRSSLETIPDDRGKIVVGLPDHKHLGYKLEEIYL